MWQRRKGLGCKACLDKDLIWSGEIIHQYCTCTKLCGSEKMNMEMWYILKGETRDDWDQCPPVGWWHLLAMALAVVMMIAQCPGALWRPFLAHVSPNALDKTTACLITFLSQWLPFGEQQHLLKGDANERARRPKLLLFRYKTMVEMA